MSAVVTDTHALLWYLSNSTRLSAGASDAFETAEQNGFLIHVPAIVLVEIRYLVEKGRDILESDFELVIAKMDDSRAALAFAPLNQVIAEAVGRIPRSIVPDMPDRLIAATALQLGLPVISRDLQIRNLQNVAVIW
jgi:PIN domain nuclease of toxin-antitoxin system